MKLVNDLRNLSLDNYNECLNYIVDTLSKNNDIVVIYQFGHIKFPGISDLDLLFVVRDDCKFKKIYSKINAVIKKAPYSNYCFYHKVIIITYKQSRYLYLFHSVESLRVLSGEDLNLTKKFSLPQILIWNSFFYPLIFGATERKHVSLRYLLLIMNNAAYSIKANDSIHKTNFHKSYTNLVNDARNQCIAGNVDKHNLIQIVDRAKNILSTQESLWSTFYVKKKWLFYLNKVIRFDTHLSIRKFYLFDMYVFPVIYGVLYSIFNNELTTCGNSIYIKSFMDYKKEVLKAMDELDLSYSELIRLFTSTRLFNCKMLTS